MVKELNESQIKRITTTIKSAGFTYDLKPGKIGFHAINRKYENFAIQSSEKNTKVEFYKTYIKSNIDIHTAKKLSKEFNRTIKLAEKIQKIMD